MRRGTWGLIGLMMLAMSCEGPAGPAGPAGAAGAKGADGTNGTNGADGTDGTDGTNGTNGANGMNGTNGTNGTNGAACWDLNANGTCEVASEDRSGDGACNVLDCQGMPGAGFIALEATGLVGFVRDTAGEPVVAATVYFVPQGSVPDAGLQLGLDMAVNRADPADEPLEDTIALQGSTFARAVTDADGIYRFTTLPTTGSYFVVVMPAASDELHLPGGQLCREARAPSTLVGKQVNLTVSTTPSASAKFVGPSVCLNCHGKVNHLATAHQNGLRRPGRLGMLQDGVEFPTWNQGIAKFTPGTSTVPGTPGTGGTTIFFYGYASSNWKVSETDPGTGVSFKARMYSTVVLGETRYYVELIDVKGTTAAATWEVDLSYGGGIYKQRYLAKLPDGARYVLPIQFNSDGAANGAEASIPFSRWQWQHYNAANWYDEAVPGLKVPAKTKSFDANCAGCHMTGFKLTGDVTAAYKAHATPDLMGEMDYDGDGKFESINTTCENCHGPGSEHWAKAGNGRAIVTPSLLTPEREVTICAACHTRALGFAGGATEAPLDSNALMPRAGISRKAFLTNHVSKIDDGLWAATNGDGFSSIKHHQQVSDFIKSKKYRNPFLLVTCSNCHDLHGTPGDRKQLTQPLEHSAVDANGQCMSCHGNFFPAGANLAARMQAHWTQKGIANIPMGDIKCTSCHMTQTMKSGAGHVQATIAGVTYFSGDIASHNFRVPRKTSVPDAGKGPEMLPMPYTNSCGAGCHVLAP